MKEDEATKLARQKKFYRAQRVNAEETGNQPMVDKIYGKLGRPSHSVDADAVNKGILGAVGTPMAAAAAPEAGAAGAVGAGLARMGGGAMANQAMQQGPKIVGAALHPIDHALAVLEQKLPGVTEKIEQAIGEHHESLGGSSPFRTYTQKALPGGVQKGAKTIDKDARGLEMAPKSARKTASKPSEQHMQNDMDYIRNKQTNNARRASAAKKKDASAPAAGRKGSQTSATPKQKGQTAAPKEQQAPKTGVKSGHIPKVGAKQAKPGASPGKTSAAPNKPAARTVKTNGPITTTRSYAAKNPYSKEGIAAARGNAPKNNIVKRKKDA